MTVSLMFLIILTVVLSIAGAGISVADDIRISSWTSQIGDNAASYAFRVQQDGALRFELRSGDCSDNRRTPECLSGRERAEMVDWHIMQHGQDAWYGYSLLIPGNAPKLPVHITLGQLWSPELVLAIRETNGVMDFAIYRGGGGPPSTRCLIPVHQTPRGKWNRFIIGRIRLSGSKWRIESYVNGQKLCVSEVGAIGTAARLPVWKIGVYRPNIGRIHGEHPTHIVYYRDLSRGTSFEDVR